MSDSSRVVDIASIGEDLPLLEGIRTTRAIRRLSTEPVPRELVRKVVEAGTFAPSGGNRQPWRFIAVTKPERRRWVAKRYRSAFDEYIRPALEARKSPDFPAAKRRSIDSAMHLAEFMHEAPVLLFVAGWKRRGQPQLSALMPAAQNILLACRAVGLGASLTMLHKTFGKEIDAWLGLSDETPSEALIPIGWPRIPYRRPVRKSVDEVLSWEKFEKP